jgi:two-component system nitrogen regulation response regulator NtrX
MIMVAGDMVSAFDLSFLDASPVSMLERTDEPDVRPLYTARESWEREYILRALALFDGNISRTADTLGVERSNLHRKMRSLGITPARRDDEH